MGTVANSRAPLPSTRTRVPVDSLTGGISPRLLGENVEHAHALAETDAPLPPILVQRDTMRVIDGMHRLLAARIKGLDTVEVRFFDGDDREAFIAAVQANIGHGLPLSLADREAAASRIIISHPQWSDRGIAEVAGLAADTVARIRRETPDQAGRADARLGRDGRLRPLSSAAGRRAASRIIADRPDATLREIAGEAGISLTTARDVRERLRRGESPVPAREARAEQRSAAARSRGRSHEHRSAERAIHDKGLALKKLRNDPALRMSEEGRRILRWLAAHALRPQDADELAASIPAHCVSLIVDVALEFGDEWKGLAEMLRATTHGHED